MFPPPPAPQTGMELRHGITSSELCHFPSYYPPPSEYSTPVSGSYADRLFPEFTPTTGFGFAYDNPSSSVSVSSSASTSTRTPAPARHHSHRRTSSNVSNTSSCGGANPSFSLEGENACKCSSVSVLCILHNKFKTT